MAVETNLASFARVLFEAFLRVWSEACGEIRMQGLDKEHD